MKKLRISVLFILLAAVLVSGAFAQHSLYDNPNYRRSLELRTMAKSAYDKGDYVKAEEYSLESERLAVIAREEAETQRLLWIANAWKKRAGDRISYCEKNGAEKALGATWTEAKGAYALAVGEYDAKRYAESTEASKKVLDLLADFSASKLPAFYTVRLIPGRRDCLWRIAEYPFIYGDPWKWKVLYEANREKLPQPDNPDLILPEMVLRIPSIKGETRSGTWSE